MHRRAAFVRVAMPDGVVGRNPPTIVHGLVEPVLPPFFADGVRPNLDRG